MGEIPDFSESDKKAMRKILGYKDEGGTWPSLESIKKEEQIIKKVNGIGDINERFSKIESILTIHTEMQGIFFHQSKIKKLLGLSYEDNYCLNNALGNQIYLIRSILILLERGYYGSARMLLRQAFEMLMIAKYSEHNRRYQKTWERGDAEHGVVKNYLKQKNKNHSNLSEFYGELCKYSHSTPLAQQFLRLEYGKVGDRVNSFEKLRLFENIAYTFDMLFVTLCMAFHLNNIAYKKLGRWYIGYSKKARADFNRTRDMKKEFLAIKKDYFRIKIPTKEKKKFLKIINEFRTSWI